MEKACVQGLDTHGGPFNGRLFTRHTELTRLSWSDSSPRLGAGPV